MNNRSLLSIGIILVCLFYILGDAFTMAFNYDQFSGKNTEDPMLYTDISPLVFYTFLIAFLLKIVLLFKAQTVSNYLLSESAVTIYNVHFEDVCIIIGVITCIIEMPDLIILIAHYTQRPDIDDSYELLFQKLPIYQSGIRLILAFALIYFRKDLSLKLKGNNVQRDQNS